jgi:glycosyltransferase involved in cell wall biosynthesis
MTVLNAVPLDRFVDADAGRVAAREALGLPLSAMVLGCVGRLVGLKNHRLMIALMPQVLAQHPDARLLLLGGGELAADLRAQAAGLGLSDRVMLAGERPDVAGLLPALDLFVMPSLTEGVSIALLEACAAGLPVVATNVGGNPEIVVSGARGLLVPPDDGPATLAAVLDLLGNPGKRKQLGLAARAWVREHASLEALTRCYDALYAQAMASRGGGRLRAVNPQ